MSAKMITSVFIVFGTMIISVLIMATQTGFIEVKEMQPSHENKIKGSWFKKKEGVGNIVCANMNKPKNEIHLTITCNEGTPSTFTGSCNTANILSLFRVMKKNQNCKCKLEWDLGTSRIISHPVSVEEGCKKNMEELELNPEMIQFTGREVRLNSMPFLELYNPLHNVIKKCFGQDKDEVVILIKYANRVAYSIIFLHSIHIALTIYLIVKMYMAFDSSSIVFEGLWTLGDLAIISLCVYLVISLSTAIEFTQGTKKHQLIVRTKRDTGAQNDCENEEFLAKIEASLNGTTIIFDHITDLKEWREDYASVKDKEALCKITLYGVTVHCKEMEKIKEVLCDKNHVRQHHDWASRSVPKVGPGYIFKGTHSKSEQFLKEDRDWSKYTIGLYDADTNYYISMQDWWEPVANMLPWKSLIDTIIAVLKQCLGIDSSTHLILIKYAITFSIFIIAYNMAEFVYSLYTIWDEFKSIENPIFLIKSVKLLLSFIFCLIGFIFLFIEIQTRKIVEHNA